MKDLARNERSEIAPVEVVHTVPLEPKEPIGIDGTCHRSHRECCRHPYEMLDKTKYYGGYLLYRIILGKGTPYIAGK